MAEMHKILCLDEQLCIILKSFLMFSDSESEYSHKLYSYKKVCKLSIYVGTISYPHDCLTH